MPEISYYHVGGQLMASVTGNEPKHRGVWYVARVGEVIKAKRWGQNLFEQWLGIPYVYEDTQ